MAPFDPYHKWLGIPPVEQPASHYRLLGIANFEIDADVIEGAAEQRTIYLRTFQTGPNSELAERLLNEVSEARVCLLDGKSKARYDTQLGNDLEPAPQEDPLAFTTEELASVSSRPSTRSRGRKPSDSGGDVILVEDELHFVDDGAAQGRISFSQLQQLIASEKVTPQTRVWKEGQQPASTFPGLVPDKQETEGDSGGETSGKQSTNPQVFSALGRSGRWATFLGGVLLLLGGPVFVNGIVTYIQGVKYENEYEIGQGVGNFIVSGVVVVLAITLFQFSSLANAAQIQRSSKTLIAALDGLRRYFLLQGLVVLLLLSMVLLLVILQAALV